MSASTVLTIEIGAASDTGLIREINEDSVIARVIENPDSNPWGISALLMVADGMGGHASGEVASQLAARTVNEVFGGDNCGSAPGGIDSAGYACAGLDVRDQWEEGAAATVRHINSLVHSVGAGSGASRPGTTLTLALLRSNEYCVGHVGDSRAYQLANDHIEQVTDDHSWVAEAIREGRMTAQDAEASPFAHQLTRTIGIEPDVAPAVYRHQWNQGNVLLLCSDGLTGCVSPSEIKDVVLSARSLQEGCDRLVELANSRGGDDNISVVAASNGYHIPVRASGPKTAKIARPRKPPTWPPAIAAMEEDFYSPGLPAPAPTRKRRGRRTEILRFAGILIIALGISCLFGALTFVFMARNPSAGFLPGVDDSAPPATRLPAATELPAKTFPLSTAKNRRSTHLQQLTRPAGPISNHAFPRGPGAAESIEPRSSYAKS